MSKKLTKYSSLIDLLIVIAIAICVIFMINAADYKIEEIFDSHRESLLVRDVEGSDISVEFADQLAQFRPDTCKMIEVYSSDFSIRLRMQFADRNVYDDNLQEYPELMQLFQSNLEGHTTIRTDDEEEDVYFRWTQDMDTGEMCLTVVYMTRPIVKNIWVISFLGYLILSMAFILLIRMYLRTSAERVRRYHDLSLDVQRKLIH